MVLMRPMLLGSQLGARRPGHLVVVLADVVGGFGVLQKVAAVAHLGILCLEHVARPRLLPAQVEGYKATLLRYRLVQVVVLFRHVLVELAAHPVQRFLLALQQNIKYQYSWSTGVQNM